MEAGWYGPNWFNTNRWKWIHTKRKIPSRRQQKVLWIKVKLVGNEDMDVDAHPNVAASKEFGSKQVTPVRLTLDAGDCSFSGNGNKKCMTNTFVVGIARLCSVYDLLPPVNEEISTKLFPLMAIWVRKEEKERTYVSLQPQFWRLKWGLLLRNPKFQSKSCPSGIRM